MAAALAEERHRKILDILEDEGGIIVSVVSENLDVSEMTVRRDLKYLEEQGLLVRVHGGAVPANSARFSVRLSSNTSHKARAVHKLAEYVPTSGTIYLDGSTTMLNLIGRLKNCAGLQVATNNIESFQRLCGITGVDALLIGGRLDKRTDNMVGSLALRSLNSIVFDAAFFSSWGITPDLGPMEVTLEDAEVKELVARRCSNVYLAIDSSKLGRLASASWKPESQKSILATDLDPADSRITGYGKMFRQIL